MVQRIVHVVFGGRNLCYKTVRSIFLFYNKIGIYARFKAFSFFLANGFDANLAGFAGFQIKLKNKFVRNTVTVEIVELTADLPAIYKYSKALALCGVYFAVIIEFQNHRQV
jgi:hypothetical protein